MDYFLGFISAIFAVFIFNLYATYKTIKFQQEIKDTAKQAADMFVAIRWERQNDVVYTYNTLDDTFVAQGQTYKEWRENFTSRFPNKQALFGLDFVDCFGEDNIDQ